jgi:hypothetical protein
MPVVSNGSRGSSSGFASTIPSRRANSTYFRHRPKPPGLAKPTLLSDRVRGHARRGRDFRRIHDRKRRAGAVADLNELGALAEARFRAILLIFPLLRRPSYPGSTFIGASPKLRRRRASPSSILTAMKEGIAHLRADTVPIGAATIAAERL